MSEAIRKKEILLFWIATLILCASPIPKGRRAKEDICFGNARNDELITKFYLITTNFLTILIFKFLKIPIEYEIYYKIAVIL